MDLDKCIKNEIRDQYKKIFGPDALKFIEADFKNMASSDDISDNLPPEMVSMSYAAFMAGLIAGISPMSSYNQRRLVKDETK